MPLFTAIPWLAAVAVASYLLGAIPFGYLVARLRGVNILHAGSGNIGATNVGRVLGRPYGFLVFLLDFSKGALPVLLARQLVHDGLAPVPVEWFAVVAGVAAFLGHLFPLYLGFRGGKGVATGAGVVVVLVPWAALAAAVAWLALVSSSRYVSLASVVAALVLAGFQGLATAEAWQGPQLVVSLFCCFAALLVIVRHTENLRRLREHRENQLKRSVGMFTFSKVLHVLALGLWFGTVVFFTLAGGLMIEAFNREAQLPAEQRPLWFPVPAALEQPRPSAAFPEPLRNEQASRAFGVAVTPLFPLYYGIQAGCGLIGVLTAVGWCLTCGRGSLLRLRAWLLVLALLTVGAGWWLEQVVNQKREPRDRLTDAVVSSTAPTATEIEAAGQARTEFVRWHLYSLGQNGLTALLVFGALALGGVLPDRCEGAAKRPDQA